MDETQERYKVRGGFIRISLILVFRRKSGSFQKNLGLFHTTLEIIGERVIMNECEVRKWIRN